MILKDDVPDQVITKISIMLEPFLEDITPLKVLAMIEHRNESFEPEPLPEEWLTTQQAAKSLSCTQQTIYNMVKSGRLTHRYLGGGIGNSKGQLRILLSNIFETEPKKKKRRKSCLTGK